MLFASHLKHQSNTTNMSTNLTTLYESNSQPDYLISFLRLLYSLLKELEKPQLQLATKTYIYPKKSTFRITIKHYFPW